MDNSYDELAFAIATMITFFLLFAVGWENSQISDILRLFYYR